MNFEDYKGQTISVVIRNVDGIGIPDRLKGRTFTNLVVESDPNTEIVADWLRILFSSSNEWSGISIHKDWVNSIG